MNQNDVAPRDPAELGARSDRWAWAFALGTALVVLGAIALGATVAATIATVLVLGGVLFAGGVLQVMQAYTEKQSRHVWGTLLAGLLYIVAGLLLLVRPIEGAASLTLVMSMFFVVGGLFRAIEAATARYPQWGWMLVSGIVTFGLGVMIAAEWPASAFWVIGLFVAAELIFHGLAWIALSLTARQLRHAAH